jgi:hypothetical protein
LIGGKEEEEEADLPAGRQVTAERLCLISMIFCRRG